MKIIEKWFEMKKGKNEKTGEIRIFDEIGFWGITAADFLNNLEELGEVEEINLHINSPGGSITDGNAIYNALKRHPAKKNVTIDGIAASMASVIAAVGDHVIMPENSFLMIHNPLVFMGGGADELRKEADLLDKMKNNAIKAYQNKAKKLTKEELSKMMDEETWIDAEQAIELGLADEIEGNADEPKTEENKHDRHKFNSIPAAAMCFFKTEKIPYNGKQKKTETGETTTGTEETVNTDTTEKFTNIESLTENNSQKQGEIFMDFKEIAMKITAASTKVNKEIDDIVQMAAQKLGAEKAQEILKNLKFPVNEKLNNAGNVENIDGIVTDIINNAKITVAEEVLKHVDTIVPVKAQNIQFGKDSREKFIEAATISMLHSAGLEKDETKVREVEKEGMLHMGLQGYCREILLQNGKSRAASMSNGQVYDELVAMNIFNPKMAASQGSGDFANAFADVANKSLQNAWANTPVTYQAWTGSDSIPDFRTKNIVRITEAGDVLEILEGESFPYTSLDDSKETAQLITVGLAFGLTRKAIINDDLNALTDIPTKLGRSLQRYINRRCYTVLYGTAMAGPTMNEDSVSMLNSSHNNYVGSGSGGAPTAATISTLRRYMINQTSPNPDGGESNTIYTRAEPRTIIYHSSYDMTIEGLMNPKYLVTGTANTAVSRQFIQKLIGVSDPVLDELMDANSHAGYYLMADPMDVGCITVYTLTGKTSPTMRRKESDVAEPLGVTWDIYYDTQVAAVDFRGVTGNYGA